MFINSTEKLIIITTIVAISAALPYNLQFSFAQVNSTSNDITDNEKFHSDIEQIIGHIKKAVFNKDNNSDTLALGHTQHPIEEILSLVSIPINNSNPNLNHTYYNDFFTLSSLALGNSSKAEFSRQAEKSIELSNKVLSTVVPANILNDTNHNISVIKDLLTTSKGEYTEGVKDGKIILMLEYQDGSSFMGQGFEIFNNTKSITKDRDSILQMFNNLTTSVQQIKDPSVIDTIVDKINKKLSNSYSNTTLANASINNEKSTAEYISNIRQLLNQVISSYQSGDTAKAKELATTAYLDNFEYIENHIEKNMSNKGEDLLRIQLRDKIGNNVPLEEIKQLIGEINTFLDKVEQETK